MIERSGSILIAEDSRDNREALKLILQLNGYKVLEAADGRQAIDMTRQENPGLILMDISLPDIDGLEALQLLRSEDRFFSLPIIIVSAYDNIEIREQAHNSGATDYICKPVDIDELKVLIDRHLSKTNTS